MSFMLTNQEIEDNLDNYQAIIFKRSPTNVDFFCRIISRNYKKRYGYRYVRKILREKY